MSDFDEDDLPRRPVRRGVSPDGRVYVHDRCGGSTRVSGRDYRHICDPFWPCTGTYCCTCRGFVPLGQVRWGDTGEPIDEYRRRVRSETPALVQAWRFGLGLVPGAALGALVGLVIALAARLPHSRLVGWVGVGAIVGALLIYFVGVPVLNRVFDVDYRRMR